MMQIKWVKERKGEKSKTKCKRSSILEKNLSPHVPFNFTAPRSFWWRAWCSLWLWQDGGKDGRSRNPSISIDRGRAAGLWSCFFTLETFRANAFDFIIPVAPGRTQWSEAKTRHRVIYMALGEMGWGEPGVSLLMAVDTRWRSDEDNGSYDND